MKKYITVAALLAAGTVFASATTLLSTDFTQGASSDWTSGQWNGWNEPHFSYGENGAIIAQPWKQNTLSTNIEIDADKSYTINFTTYANGTENQIMFYLSSNSYSFLIGNSYKSNPNIAVGYVNQSVKLRTEDTTVEGASLITFQGSNPSNPDSRVVATAYNESTLSGFSPIDCVLKYSYGTIEVSITQGSTQWASGEIEIGENISFDQIGFIFDGSPGSAGIQSISIKAIPEPSAFGLLAGLGALALVGTRRRRR